MNITREILQDMAWIGGVLHDLEDLHLRACLQAKPDPEELANILFKFELNTLWDTFYHAYERYADILV